MFRDEHRSENLNITATYKDLARPNWLLSLQQVGVVQGSYAAAVAGILLGGQQDHAGIELSGCNVQ